MFLTCHITERLEKNEKKEKRAKKDDITVENEDNAEEEMDVDAAKNIPEEVKENVDDADKSEKESEEDEKKEEGKSSPQSKVGPEKRRKKIEMLHEKVSISIVPLSYV